MGHALKPLPPGSVKLLPSRIRDRFDLNYRYLMSLESKNLLQNHYLEAGLWKLSAQPKGCHWGWESPTCQLRGHFLGHWLSAAARIYVTTKDQEVKAKADKIVSELGRCQQENGGGWAGSIPEKYLEWVARGKRVWAPHYTVHKTLMGLQEMFELAGNAQALEILCAWADWFHRWTGRFSRQEMDDILDVETGGMLEVWANLYGITGRQEHLDLILRYDRPRLFEPLLAGEDVLTNRHANTTIPEIHGAARAWEVTGEKRWQDIALAYWRSAVPERGFYCTGGQTCDENWTPPGRFSARLGETNQEHCTVYNMMRLAEYLFRWTGEAAYADYWERNLVNGILAQQSPETGMVAYFLPLRAGSVKRWGSPTENFWCCHGTVVQAHASHATGIFFEHETGLMVSQHIPSELMWEREGRSVRMVQQVRPAGDTAGWNASAGSVTSEAGLASGGPGASSLVLELDVSSDRPVEFEIRVRIPWWVRGEPSVRVNGEAVAGGPPRGGEGFVVLKRVWREDKVSVTLPSALEASPLPDEPDTVAFMDGPVVLAGVVEEERTLYGDRDDPWTMLTPDYETAARLWPVTGGRLQYRTCNQERNFKLIPLYEVCGEVYTVYFPVRQRS